MPWGSSRPSHSFATCSTLKTVHRARIGLRTSFLAQSVGRSMVRLVRPLPFILSAWRGWRPGPAVGRSKYCSNLLADTRPCISTLTYAGERAGIGPPVLGLVRPDIRAEAFHSLRFFESPNTYWWTGGLDKCAPPLHSGRHRFVSLVASTCELKIVAPTPVLAVLYRAGLRVGWGCLACHRSRRRRRRQVTVAVVITPYRTTSYQYMVRWLPNPGWRAGCFRNWGACRSHYHVCKRGLTVLVTGSLVGLVDHTS